MNKPRLNLMKKSFLLKGLNLERFLNLMQKEGIPLLKIRRRDVRTLECICYAADMESIRQIAGEKGWRYTEGKPVGAAALFSRLKSRPGALIGAVLALCVLLGCLRFVWVVKIQGAGPYQAEIAAYLKENGAKPGVLISRIDAKDWENRLTLRYPKIAWFHVYVSGMTMVVDVTRGRPAPEEENTSPGDLVASRDGIITEIRVYSGTAAVKSGEVVRRGQVLIRGEERGRDETLIAVKASGVVMARCWKQVIVQTPILTTVDMETGREMTVTQLVTPWLTFPEHLEEPQYLHWNTYISEVPVGGAFFPLCRKTVTYREVSLEYAMPDQQQLIKETRQAAEKRLKESLRGYEIIDKWEDYCMIEDEKLSVSMTGEWQMDIGQDSI